MGVRSWKHFFLACFWVALDKNADQEKAHQLRWFQAKLWAGGSFWALYMYVCVCVLSKRHGIQIGQILFCKVKWWMYKPKKCGVGGHILGDKLDELTLTCRGRRPKFVRCDWNVWFRATNMLAMVCIPISPWGRFGPSESVLKMLKKCGFPVDGPP